MNKLLCSRLRIILALTLCLLLVLAGCGETGAKGPRMSSLPSTSRPVVSVIPDTGVQTAKLQTAEPEGSPVGIWLYDKDIQLPLVLYSAHGLQYSMILGADFDNGETYNATRQAKWSVEDPAVATVELGVITALHPGKTILRAQYGKFKAETPLVVFDTMPDRLILDTGGVAAKAGGEPLAVNALLGFEGHGEYPANSFLQVYSSAPAVVKAVAEGGELLLYGLKAGEAQVIISAFGLAEMVVVTVTEN